ncbi:hypothetical protein [Phocaeicola coprophilus]|uniref:Uncharacterized protein n=1 Tax=Phocaeicola coprophilus TaxID=387090 RepID=A0A413T5C8_9BACT|nr:hypothetical protein [Phocaeicola coprophilus]RHA79003.1 hypothetical protein DW921_00640 [Phocaeicola coprophilus]
MERKEWITVPGFPGYKVNGNREIRSLKRNRDILLKLRGRDGAVSVFDEDKVRHTLTWVRFYFCAVRQIDPRKLERKGLFISIQDGAFKVETLRERIRSIQTMPSYRDVPVTMEELKERFAECMRFMDMVMEYYRTGNGESLTALLYRMEGEQTVYMVKSLRLYDPEVRKDIFSEAVDTLLRTLDKRDRIIANPRTFMYKAVRNLTGLIRKQKNIQRKLNESYLTNI